MAVTGSLQLLNKRLVLINTAQVIGGSNDRGEFNVPIPQQLQDPAANDLVYKMYIQSLTIQNEQPGVNLTNNKFRIALSTVGLTTIPDGPIGAPIDVELPVGDFSAKDVVDFINFLLARERQVGNGNNYILPKFAVEGTDQERVYVPKSVGNIAPQSTLPFGTNGDYLCFVPQATSHIANWNGEEDTDQTTPYIDPPAEAHLLDGLRLTLTFADPAGHPNRSNLLLGFPGQASAVMAPMGTGITKANGLVQYGGTFDTGFVPAGSVTSLSALNARPWRSVAPMLVDDFSELYLQTDLPTNNYGVTMSNGLGESHVTAVIPVTGGVGTRIQYLDDKGINGAFQRNQSTITRLSVKLTNKYGEKVVPISDWTMVLAIEAYQDHWKTMSDIQMASQDFHGEQLRLAKLQLLHSYFTTQTGQSLAS